MKRMMIPFLMAALSACALFAQQLSTTPTPRDAGWIKRVERDAAQARKGGWDVVFIGDSITDFWQSHGKAEWAKAFAPFKALNLGISADRTEHVLWRLDNGQLENNQPKLFVVMIGTNNTGHRPADKESTADTVAGIKAILDRLAQKAPHSKVLLHAIFPRGATPQDAHRQRNEAINAEIQKFADNKRVFWMNINDKFLQSDGTLSKEVMPDLLHPNAKGYAIWAEAILPFIQKSVKTSVTPDHRMDQAWWKQRFEQKVALAKQGGWDVVFLGDSITHGWEGAGRKVWDEHFGAYKALNLGYGGDRTEHVLWRLENGELDGYQPKLLILMIGTNNTGHRPAVQETPQDTADGIKAILELIARKSPSTKVLLLGIFPRGAGPSDAARIRNSQVNDLIKAYADGTRVTYMDLGPQMLESDGTLSREMMPDLLHPKEKGYGIWARAVLPVIKETLGK
jgi:lysophospholipase L1-like esterase